MVTDGLLATLSAKAAKEDEVASLLASPPDITPIDVLAAQLCGN